MIKVPLASRKGLFLTSPMTWQIGFKTCQHSMSLSPVLTNKQDIFKNWTASFSVHQCGKLFFSPLSGSSLKHAYAAQNNNNKNNNIYTSSNEKQNIPKILSLNCKLIASRKNEFLFTLLQHLLELINCLACPKMLSQSMALWQCWQVFIILYL